MAITTRQSSLLVAEDWTKLYQTFRNADFQSYDYETLRKSMVDYLRLYYPEDFNDFIESSEFIALIDLISFMGQSVAFRADLNARENFIDTAQRRDSILKLARLISYTPKRNIPASGLLKIESVSTTETVFDSNGLNLAGLVITWGDTANDNWAEQFNIVLNASLNSTQAIGKPASSKIINNILTDTYQINLISSLQATFSYTAGIEGSDTAFEMVSPTTDNQTYIYEVAPGPNKSFNILYRNDNLGNGSNNTGYFTYFKQGGLTSIDVNFAESLPNRVYGLNVNNINNSDIWVYALDANGNLSTEWTEVPSVGATNIIYNKTTNKNIYQVNTRAGDQVDLVFGDGSFANVPQGRFKIFYRVSNGLTYKVTPSEMTSVDVPVNYISRGNRAETLNIITSLRYTVTNATSRETVDEVRQKAPQQYYTQDRMVTGEDYNILPYTLFNSVLKVKAINRTSSGVSRYLDVIDTTGKYSSTNIFCDDGYLYKDLTTNSFNFSFATVTDIYKAINNQVKPITSKKETQQFFYSNYDEINTTDTYWNKSLDDAGITGYFYDTVGTILQVGDFVSDNKRYIKQGSIIKFSPGTGNYFDSRNTIQTGVPTKNGDKNFLYAQVIQVLADGTNGGQGNLSSGNGPITLNQVVPTGAEAVRVFPVFNNEISAAVVATMVSYIQAYKDFGLRYDVTTSAWTIILPEDLDSTSAFSLSNTGNTAAAGLDASWIIRFQATGQTYTVYYRGLEYIFGSIIETNFYFDGQTKIFDPVTGFTIRDEIKVLKINTKPDTTTSLELDYNWNVYDSIVNSDGYKDNDKILVTFPDSNDDGIPDNPELFEIIVAPAISSTSKYIYFYASSGYDNFVIQTVYNASLVVSIYTSLTQIETNKTLYQNGQIFYVPNTNVFYDLTVVGTTYTVAEVSGYTAKVGRQDLYFQYRHNSPNNKRIDPSPNNIVDLYILTKTYSTDYLAWVQDVTNTLTQPTAPTPEELGTDYSTLENYKTVSDTIIYNPAKFKPIFGDKAEASLQATFKVVKNNNVVVSDNDVKTSVIAAVNTYFDIANWDFGETFYFSELSAYLHQQLAPIIASVTLVPTDTSETFGSLLQINAEYNEIIISAATVDNVQIITAITAAQLYQRGGRVAPEGFHYMPDGTLMADSEMSGSSTSSSGSGSSSSGSSSGSSGSSGGSSGGGGYGY